MTLKNLLSPSRLWYKQETKTLQLEDTPAKCCFKQLWPLPMVECKTGRVKGCVQAERYFSELWRLDGERSRDEDVVTLCLAACLEVLIGKSLM